MHVDRAHFRLPAAAIDAVHASFLPERAGQIVDVLVADRFGDGDQQPLGHVGPVGKQAAHGNAAQYLAPGQRIGDLARVLAGQPHRELVEEIALVDDFDAGDRAQPLRRLQRPGMVDARQPAQPVAAQQRHVDRERQRAQARIGADIAGRLLAPDMLLARRERQHEAALAVRVHRLAAQPSGHLAHEFLARAEQAQIGSAEIQADAQRLPLAHHDIGAERSGAFQQPQGHRLGHHRDQQRALGMRGIGDRWPDRERGPECRDIAPPRPRSCRRSRQSPHPRPPRRTIAAPRSPARRR